MKVESNQDPRIIRCFDALYYSFELLKYNYTELFKCCPNIKVSPEMLIPTLSHCWMIIDLIYKIREISQAIPGLGHQTKELKKFLDKTKVAELFRHYIQHLRQKLSKRDLESYPVWGSLSWVDQLDNSTNNVAIFGTPIDAPSGKKLSVVSCAYDRFARKWVSRISLAIGEAAFNIDPLHQDTIEYKEFILPWMMNHYTTGLKEPSKPITLSARIMQTPPTIFDERPT